MTQWFKNVARLSRKEIFSLFSDATLMALIVFAFTLAVYSVAKGIKAEVSNASVAIVDGDHSALSRRLRDAVQPPYFKPPVDIAKVGIFAGDTAAARQYRDAGYRMIALSADVSWLLRATRQALQEVRS